MNVFAISHALATFLQLHNDQQVGVAVVDRFTNAALEFLERIGPHSNASLAELVRVLARHAAHISVLT